MRKRTRSDPLLPGGHWRIIGAHEIVNLAPRGSSPVSSIRLIYRP